MYKINKLLLVILFVTLSLPACKTRFYPFYFQKDISAELLKETLKLQAEEDKNLQFSTGKAYVYSIKFIEGWLNQDNFIDRAVLSEDRVSEFTPYDQGYNNLYRNYLILFALKGSTAKPFLLFTVQYRSGWDGVTGFSKVYYGKYSKNGTTPLLSASKILQLQYKNDKYFFKESRETHLRFILDSPAMENLLDYRPEITKIVYSDKNELSGSKTLEIPVDEVMGKAHSLNYKKPIIIEIP